MSKKGYTIMKLLLVWAIILIIGSGCVKKPGQDSTGNSGANNTSANTQSVGDVKPAPDQNKISEGYAFPDMSFTSLTGQEINISDMKGKVVLVDFWATWCPPCRKAMPDLVETYKEYNPKGFEVVGISFDKDKSALEKYVEENGMQWQQYYDGLGWDNKIGKRFGVRSIPHIVLIDKNGAVAFNTDYKNDKAPLHGDELKNAIAGLLK